MRKDSAIKIMSEFMSPFEDSLTVLMLGDHMHEYTKQEIVEAFDDMRRSFISLPDIKHTRLEPLKHLALTTSQLYRGEATKIGDEPCVVFLDKELSNNVINMLTNNEQEVDDLDKMLLNQYLFSLGHEKYVLDTRDCNHDQLMLLLDNMDIRTDEFNYLQIDNMLGIWIYNTQEFTSLMDI